MSGYKRGLLPLIGAASLVLAAGAVQTAGASATTDVCRITVKSLQANDLQESGKDETFMQLGDTRTPSLKYADNQTRSNIGNDDFVGNEKVSVVEDDLVGDDLIGSFKVPCANDSDKTVLAGNGAIYTVKWAVIVLP